MQRRLEELLSYPFPDGVEALIVDNDSSDGTYERLVAMNSSPRIRVLKNETNVGFAGNFVEVIRNARTDYVLWSSDEDSIVEDSIPTLLSFLRERVPDVVVPDYYMDYGSGNVQAYRSIQKSEVLEPLSGVAGISHLPGLIVNRDRALGVLSGFDNLQRTYPDLSRYYPHYFLFFELIPHRKSFRWNRAVSVQRDFLPKSHKPANDGTEFFHICSRWRQHKEGQMFLLERIENEANADVAASRREMLTAWNAQLYIRLRNAVRKESDEQAALLDESARAYLASKSPNLYRRRFGRILRKTLSTPIAFGKSMIHILRR